MKKIYAISLLRGISSTDLYESHSLGLNKRAKREHSSMSGDEDLAAVTCDDILRLYKKYSGASLRIVDPDWQYSMLHVHMKLSEALNTEVEIGKSYSKFIKIVTNGEYTCKFTNEWGEEKLDAIEFWKNDGRRKTLRNRDYGEEKYFTEIRDFFSNKKNYIVDWFIPATAKWLEMTPNARHYFLEDQVNESNTSLGLNKRAKQRHSDKDAIDNLNEYVDLGLPSGTLWRKCNYGADEEYEVGDCLNCFNIDRLEKSDQAQIPSIEDFKELVENCTFKPSEKGQKLTSNLNGNSIFIQLGGYWTSSKKLSGVKLFQYYVTINDISIEYHSTANAHRYDFFLRPVLKKVNESTNLGLNKRAKEKFSKEDHEDAMALTKDDLVKLYDKYGEVTIEFQDIRGPIKNPSENIKYRMIFEEISNSYSKFIWDMTDGIIAFSSTVYLYTEKRQFYNLETKETEYEESNEPKEFNKILWNNGNIIIDGYIPSTIKWLKAHPEYISGFLRKM